MCLSENLLSENGVLPNSLGEAVFSQLMFKKAVEIMKKKQKYYWFFIKKRVEKGINFW